MSIEKLELPDLKEKSIQKTQAVKETNTKLNSNIKQLKQIQKMQKRRGFNPRPFCV